MEVTANKVGFSDEIALNRHQNNFKVTLVCEGTGFSGNYTVEYKAGGSWIPHDELVGKTGNEVSNIFFPVDAVRLKMDAVNGGSMKLIALQGA